MASGSAVLRLDQARGQGAWEESMMGAFNVRKPYSPERDVRSHGHLLDLLQSLPDNGVLFPLVGARRAGKTWTLKAIEHHLGRVPAGTALYIDLRKAGAALP